MRPILAFVALVTIYSSTTAALAAPPALVPAKSPSTPYEFGLQAYLQGDFAKASVYFEEALKKTQNSPMLWYYDAICFHQLKNWSMAKSRYKTAATYFPNTPAGKAALDALKKIDPSFSLPVAAAPVAPTGGAAAPADKGAVMTASTASKTSPAASTDEEEAAAALAKEMATLPDTAHFYFKKGPSGHMEVDLMVNGHPVKALFDTGATAFFYKDQLKEAGLDLNAAKAGGGARGWAGKFVPTTVIPAKVTLGTLTRNIEITMQESTSGIGRNLIGQDLVRGYQYEIDDKGGRVDLKKTIALKHGESNPLYDIPLTVVGKNDVIPLLVNGKNATAFIDTGAASTIFSAWEAERLGVQPTGETVHMTGVGGNVVMRRGIATIRIGGMLRESFPILIGGSGGCALGQDLMDGWRYKVDREHKLLRFFH